MSTHQEKATQALKKARFYAEGGQHFVAEAWAAIATAEMQFEILKELRKI